MTHSVRPNGMAGQRVVVGNPQKRVRHPTVADMDLRRLDDGFAGSMVEGHEPPRGGRRSAAPVTEHPRSRKYSTIGRVNEPESQLVDGHDGPVRFEAPGAIMGIDGRRVGARQ